MRTSEQLARRREVRNKLRDLLQLDRDLYDEFRRQDIHDNWTQYDEESQQHFERQLDDALAAANNVMDKATRHQIIRGYQQDGYQLLTLMCKPEKGRYVLLDPKTHQKIRLRLGPMRRIT